MMKMLFVHPAVVPIMQYFHRKSIGPKTTIPITPQTSTPPPRPFLSLGISRSKETAQIPVSKSDNMGLFGPTWGYTASG